MQELAYEHETPEERAAREVAAELLRSKPQGIAYICEDDDAIVLDTFDHGVMLSVTVDLALRFRTRAAFDRWLEHVAKQWVNP